MTIDPKQLQAAFFEAIAAKPDERAGVLNRVCAGNTELRKRVELLLRAHHDGGELPPAAGEADRSGPGADDPARTKVTDAGVEDLHSSAANPRPDLQPGKIFAGRYKLREKLGEGGMGIVWVADQTAPVQRRIALKVIKSAEDSRRLLARFEQERQALALMDHPNIAKVLDAGVDDEGRPYFVMELIKGVPLTKYCDEARLTPRERLQLFVPVCQAVQHAHQKGVIHRDLKPLNILVGLYDGRPVPKVIDFGVAKATGPQFGEHSIYTEVGAMIGTLEYMSPEQAELNNLDIDTRSDIYALGAILYELLTGTVPFSGKEMKAAGFAEMLRIIKEVEPPRPSTRLSGSGTLPSVAALRHTEPRQLTRLVEGELDWIAMRCLEKDRSRRYETANGLARDIERYLADEVVEARPPSASYRLKKVLRRNKGPVIATGLILFALLAGITGTTWGLIEARRQERIAGDEATKKEKALEALAVRAEGEFRAKTEAEAKRSEAEQQKSRAERGEKLAEERLVQVVAEKNKAVEENQMAQAVRYFLQVKLLGQADATNQANDLLQAGGLSGEAKENPTVRELLDRAARELTPDKIESNFPNQALVQAEILQEVGVTYRGIGEYERAIGFLERSLNIYRRQLGAELPNTLLCMNSLASSYQSAGKLDLALPLFEETLKIRKTRLGPEHPDTLASMNNLALAYTDAGKPNLALPLFEETLRIRNTRVGPEHPDTLYTRHNLARAYYGAGRTDLALPLFEETLELRKAKLGPEHPDTLHTMNNLAATYLSAGKLDLAVSLFEETFKLRKAKLGPEHPLTLSTMSNLAESYRVAGELDLALSLLKETLKLQKAKLGPEHTDTLSTMSNLAAAYCANGNMDLALPILTESLKLRTAKLGPEHPDTLFSKTNLAAAYRIVGRTDLAIPLLVETLEHQKAKLGPEHHHTLTTLDNLALAYQSAGKLDLALPHFEEAIKLRKAALGPRHRDTLHSMQNLATACSSAGKLAVALTLFEETLELQKAALGPAHPETVTTMNNLAAAYFSAGKLNLAIPLCEETLRGRTSGFALRGRDTVRCGRKIV